MNLKEISNPFVLKVVGKENNSSSSAVLIAVEIKNDNGRFYVSLVDNQDTFTFSIVRIAYKARTCYLQYSILLFFHNCRISKKSKG